MSCLPCAVQESSVQTESGVRQQSHSAAMETNHLHLRGEHAWFAAAAVREILPSNPMVIPFPRNTTPAGPDMDGDHPEDLRRTGTRKS